MSFDELEIPSLANGYAAARDLGCSPGRRSVGPASQPYSRDCWFWSFEGFIAIHIKRKYSPRESPWSVFPRVVVVVGETCKNKAVIYSGQAKNKCFSEMSKICRRQQPYPSGRTRDGPESELFAFNSSRRENKVLAAQNSSPLTTVLTSLSLVDGHLPTGDISGTLAV